ncbi:RelA/SpoT family protein [Ureaplasma canigenitalium]|uniref:RelA/SpoT family protein n=1 Tax=Ureaplasma canigenitalium TaxID=42092 RepID=UPI0004E1B91B|nr:RelA/SpoT family protein [Ureaplasma canigenitalium]
MEKIINQYWTELENVLTTKKYDDSAIKRLYDAFLFAKQWHGNQLRKSGEPYIIHPIATTRILAEWDMDVDTLIAGMLHDVLEDTEASEEMIYNAFGKDVHQLVKFVTKVSLYSKQQRKNLDVEKLVEDYSIQVFMSMSQDIRAMIIKIADRYHNMQTINFVKPEKAKRIAKETLEIYASIAGRLGMYKVKTALLDMSFAILDPDNFKKTSSIINNLQTTNQKTWEAILRRIKSILTANNIEARVESRIKGIYSTYKKYESGYEIKQIHDIYAIRVILDDVYKCYHTLGLIHTNFTYIINTFKDYISTPKWNLYQSIHTTISYEDTLAEIQIRTQRMDYFANNGLAAHWKYKEGSINNKEISLTINNLLLRDFINKTEKDIKSIKEVTMGTIFDVLVLNDNRWITVGHGSTLLDVAYKFDRDKFFNILAIYRNGERSHFDTHVESGDTIKIAYTENNTETIKNSWLTASNNEVVRNFMKEHLDKYLQHQESSLTGFLHDAEFYLEGKISSLDYITEKIKKEFNVLSIGEFIENTKIAEIDSKLVYEVFSENKKRSNEAITLIKNKAWKWLTRNSYFQGLENLFFTDFEIAKCCTKVPGMSVVAKIVRNKVEIHRSDCHKVKNSKAKIIVIEWSMKKLQERPRFFIAMIAVKGKWTESIGNQMAQTLTKTKANIVKIDIKKNKATKMHDTLIMIYVKDLEHLERAILELNVRNTISEWRII